jgi:hypothetical protein
LHEQERDSNQQGQDDHYDNGPIHEAQSLLVDGFVHLALNDSPLVAGFLGQFTPTLTETGHRLILESRTTATTGLGIVQILNAGSEKGASHETSSLAH